MQCKSILPNFLTNFLFLLFLVLTSSALSAHVFIILCMVLLPVRAENVLSSLKFCHYSSHCDTGNQTCSRKCWVIISIFFFLPDHYLFPLSSNRIFLGRSSSPLKLLYMIQRYLYQLLSPRSLFDIVTTRHQIIWQQSFIREALDLG